MFPKAREALMNQLKYTTECELVFHNPNTNQDWANSTKVGEVWKKYQLRIMINVEIHIKCGTHLQVRF